MIRKRRRRSVNEKEGIATLIQVRLLYYPAVPMLSPLQKCKDLIKYRLRLSMLPLTFLLLNLQNLLAPHICRKINRSPVLIFQYHQANNSCLHDHQYPNHQYPGQVNPPK